MSYCITLTFYPDIKANQVFKKAQQIAKNKLDNLEKVIDENYPYCPASMYNANYFSIEEYRKKRLYNLEKLWIENIFTETFLERVQSISCCGIRYKRRNNNYLSKFHRPKLRIYRMEWCTTI